LFAPVLVGAFVLLGLVGVWRHEPWADEVHAWLVAIRSDDMTALVHNCRTYGHPLLWNVLAFLLSRVTQDVLWMQLLHLAIATGSVYIFVRFAPFSNLNKFLFVFGYFILFEYAMIARAYVIGLLCVWSFCALYATKNRTYVGLALVLGVLANTSVFGAILAITFALTLVADALLRSRMHDVRGGRPVDALLAALVLIVGVGLSIAQMLPPPGEGFPAAWRTDVNLLKLAKVLSTVWNSYVPLPDVVAGHFWERNLLDRAYPEYLHLVGPIHVALSIGLLAVGVLAFARRPVVLFCYLCGTGGLLLFEYTKYFGFLRHHGHLFILLVACMWLARSYTPAVLPLRLFDAASRRVETKCGTLFTALLAIHLLAGVYVYVLDLRYPFAGAQAVAQAIKDEGLAEQVDACYPDWLCASYAYLFHRQFYYPNVDRIGDILAYERNRLHNLECSELVRRVRAFTDRGRGEVLFLSFVKLDCAENDPHVSLVREFHVDAFIHGDSYWYLYRVSPVER